jgi:hypothetical protein
MARKEPQIERLADVLDKSLKRLDLTLKLDAYGVWPIWNEVVGTAIARNAQPEKIRNGTLFVKVSSPVWMQQLQFMKELIAEKLNQRLKGEVVKNIFFMVGRLDEPETHLGADARAQDSGAPVQPVREVNDEFLQSIEDPEIRDAFKRLLKSFARREAKR